MLGDNGLLAGAKRGLIVVDCSTSEPDSTTKLRARCDSAGVSFVDAPLARTPVEAELGKLNVMIGATPETYATLEPVLKRFAENVFHVGGPGAGHIIKLLNNFIAQAICTATAEAFAVGQKAGVDLNKLVALISAGAVNSGIFQMMAKSLQGDLAGLKFELDNARKDIRYYTHPGREPERADRGRRGGAPVARARQRARARQEVRAVADRGAGAGHRREDPAAVMLQVRSPR